MGEVMRNGRFKGLEAGLLAASGVALVLLGSAFYTHAAEPMLRAMDASVGEVLKDRGLRQERAGEFAVAEHTYRTALRATFNGAEHRAEAEERLGRIRLAAGDAVEALPLLKAAAEHPDRRESALPALALARGRLGDDDGALKALAEATPASDARKLEAGQALVIALTVEQNHPQPPAWEAAPRAWRWTVAPFVFHGVEPEGPTGESPALFLRYLASGLGEARPAAWQAWESGTEAAPCPPLQALLKCLSENS